MSGLQRASSSQTPPGHCGAGPRSPQRRTSTTVRGVEASARLSLFADCFIERQRARHLDGAAHATKGAVIANKPQILSGPRPRLPQQGRAPGKARIGPSQFRHSSLPPPPPPLSSSSSSSSSSHSKLKPKKAGAESIPFKSSPRQPLLEKRHAIRSIPLVLGCQRDTRTFQPPSTTGSSRFIATTPGGGLNSNLNLPNMSKSPSTILTGEPAPPLRGAEKFSYQISPKSAPPSSHQSLGSRGSLRQSGPKPGSKSTKRRHSLIARSVSHECDGRGKSPTGVSGRSRRHLSAEALELGGRGGSRRKSVRFSGLTCRDTKIRDALMGEGLAVEDVDDFECSANFDEGWDEEGGSLGEGGADEEFFEEELTDLEDTSCDETCSSIHDPFTCVQKSVIGNCGEGGREGPGEGGPVSQGGFLGQGLTGAVEDELLWRLRQLDSSNDGTQECDSNKDSCSPEIESDDMERVHSAAKPDNPVSLKPPSSRLPVVKTESAVTASIDLSSLGAALRGSDQPSPPLTPSLFPGVPPTIHFPLPDENYTPLPKEKRDLLKWKMSTITPNVVTSCIAKVGFTKCTRGSGWLGYWGKHMKSTAFKEIREYQKVNHFPGTFQIGRKDRLWRNLSRMQTRVGKKDCDFVPLTFVLPADLRQLRREWEEGSARQNKWILKPPAAARGIGVRVIHRWDQVPKKKPTIVQRYLSDPYLINGSKFDLRVYVYVSSYDPLRIYVFREGLTRFATCKYSHSMKSLANKFAHLTNYSINKRNTAFTPNSDETVCQGHKWGLLALWRYMKTELGIDPDPIWESIKELVVKTIICCESYVSPLVKTFVRKRFSCHELFGFDVMFDRNLKPWILEVNISPSLHSNSQLDVNIKGHMMRDVLNMSSFRLPSRAQLAGETTATHLSAAEKTKHTHFLHKAFPESERHKILESLLPDDMTTIAETEDELAHCGAFERVFPSHCGRKYRKFFETERYYNILLVEWSVKYHSCPQKGISLLRELMLQSKKGQSRQAQRTVDKLL